MAEPEKITGSLETEIDLQTVVKSYEALVVLNSQDGLSYDVQTNI